MVFSLPDGLPSGRFERWGSVEVWVSGELPDDVDELWVRLLGRAGVTGLYPHLCRPGSPVRPVDPGAADAVDLEGVLAADFAEYRRRRLPFWSAPASVEVPEDVEPWPHDPGPPFTRWPGLAPAVPDSGAGPTPEEAAARTVADLLCAEPYAASLALALVPARRSADVPAVAGWSRGGPLPLLGALLRSWEERFGARVVAAYGGELHVSVARPPLDPAHAELLALEHVLTTADNIVDDPPTPFLEYARELVGRTDWRFWWD
ncbi:DUF4253 domain-containing protein [Streptomyces sp. SID13726]|uniref:DUF4253 domain-containing protein n=1 Tax=Streptomyces sp. SID13726 TaxID=2706058 RepID=UPI0013B74353|nr:DUF4253 domain-containing protein [Streptomyces sp. SID13726]NEB02067.1 DUF4253 domain-containing protein [Streptomyces sp. SID13726]